MAYVWFYHPLFSYIFIITSEPKQTNPPSKFHYGNLPERPPTASEMRDIYGD